jgi:hypothetical protein
MANDNLDVPKQDNEETNSALVRGSRAQQYSHPHVQFGDGTQGDFGEDEDPENNRGRAVGYDPLAGGRIAQFGEHFHIQGDAATFLYKLVFMNEVPAYNTAPKVPSSSGATQGLHTESSYSSGDDLYSDTEDFDTADDSTPQEPGRVVNQLLLAWTSLSQSEIEKGVADIQPTATHSATPKHAYVESDDESEDEHGKNPRGRSNWPDHVSH